MAEGSSVSKAQLKRELDSLSRDLFNLDLQIQDLKRQPNTQAQIRQLEQAKLQVQEKGMEKQIELEIKEVQTRKARWGRC